MTSESKVPRFFVDSTIQRLGKWLRYLGLDVSFIRSGEDFASDGILLTKKRKIKGRTGRIVLVPFDRIEEQLFWFMKRYPSAIDPQKMGSRCIRCNQALVTISRDAVRDKVPDYIFQTHKVFKTCPKCRRIYWKGSHPDRMRIYLGRIGVITKDES
jgi:uncharacterized protein with PIN domain